MKTFIVYYWLVSPDSELHTIRVQAESWFDAIVHESQLKELPKILDSGRNAS